MHGSSAGLALKSGWSELTIFKSVGVMAPSFDTLVLMSEDCSILRARESHSQPDELEVTS